MKLNQFCESKEAAPNSNTTTCHKIKSDAHLNFMISGLHYSIQPSNNNNAFFLFEPNVKKNSTTRSIFIQGDCPAFTDSHITVSSGLVAVILIKNVAFYSGNREETAFFYSEYQPKLHCAVNFKLVQNTVSLVGKKLFLK